MPLTSPFSIRRAMRMVLLALALQAASSTPCAAQPSAPGAVAPAPRDSAALLQRLYGPGQARLVWHGNRDGQAGQAIALLRAAPAHGLDPDHYDADALARQLDLPGAQQTEEFDRALSTAMLRFLSDLHFGRVAPDGAQPDLQQGTPPFDPAEHLRLALQASRLPQAVEAAAPGIPLYRRVQAALEHYRRLAAAAPAWTAPSGVPGGGKLLAGRPYPGLDLLRQRLILLGDLDEEPAPLAPDLHTEALADALKRFQSRHALAESGALDRPTLAALAVPLGHRVRQLELTLERLRWLPALRPGRVIIVNVAAFRLWAFDTSAGGGEPLGMRVIVGKAARTPTPLFIGQMRYLEFNPYWNVPRSIAVGEIIPKLARDPAYLSKNGMEMVSPAGQVVAPSLAGLRAGQLRVRQRPGAHNVLGAVKFAMPNPMNIYLHSTSARELFGKARRDLSHGCIRVEGPAELARFVLADQPQWSAQAIDAAMQPGPMRTVRLGEAIPVVLFYATAGSERNGRAVFAEDIYRRDDKLLRALQAR